MNKPNRRFTRVYWGGALGVQNNRLYLPLKLLKIIDRQPGTKITLKIGQLVRYITIDRVYPDDYESDQFIFTSPDIFSLCQLPGGQALTLLYNPFEDVVRLGPIIGLLTVRNIAPDTVYGTQEPVLAALSQLSNEINGLVYVFCPEDIDWPSATVMGQLPVGGPEGVEVKWSSFTLPLPDVIYDRIPTRSVETRTEVMSAKSRLMELPWTTYFNPRFLNKWETHLVLQDSPLVSGYLPPTKLVETSQDIIDFLSKYKSIFLKPTSGSLGRRIIRVDAYENNQYHYMYRSRNKETISDLSTDLNALLNKLKPVMGKRTYIVQKNLNLAKFENCPFDIRVLVQKDMHGNWRRTKIYVRAAAPDSFLSNLSDGGTPKSIRAVLKEVFDSDFQDEDGLAEELRKSIRLIPPVLEASTGMIWGELGLDLGIDYHGKIWLIEINSKPFKALVSDSGSKQIKRSLMRPLEFAKFQAGFYSHSPIDKN